MRPGVIGGIAALVLGLAALGAFVAGCTDRTVYMRIDRGVHYTDLRVGKGASARAGNFIELHYRATLPDGTRIADTRESGRSHRFTVGDGSVIRGLDVAVRGMRVGGVRRITVLPDSHVGRDGYGALVPPHTPMIFEVEMVRVAQAPPPVRSPLTSAVGR